MQKKRQLIVIQEDAALPDLSVLDLSLSNWFNEKSRVTKCLQRKSELKLERARWMLMKRGN